MTREEQIQAITNAILGYQDRFISAMSMQIDIDTESWNILDESKYNKILHTKILEDITRIPLIIADLGSIKQALIDSMLQKDGDHVALIRKTKGMGTETWDLYQVEKEVYDVLEEIELDSRLDCCTSKKGKTGKQYWVLQF